MERRIKFSAYDRHEEEWEYAEKAYELYELFYGYSDGQLKWLRQYIGVKDINNDEIYEGDIVATKHGRKKHLVKYTPWGCMPFSAGNYHEDSFYGDDLEIVGNKFQNKDLLEEAKTYQHE